MMKKNNHNPLRITALVVLAVLAVFALSFGIPVIKGILNPVSLDNTALAPALETQVSLPAVNLLGIWQQNGFMAAGWADRYHFYPSGNFHFYPNEMMCVTEKIQKIGVWKVENNLLTLTTAKNIIRSYEKDSNGFCTFKEEKEVMLAQPAIEQLTIIDNGTIEGDIYPSVSLNGLQFWKFSDDASSYGDEKFQE